MMPVMVKEADLNRIEVPEDYEVLDATALGRRLGFKRDTVLAYLSRRNFRRIPRPNRQLAMGPIWYEKSVREWEAKEESQSAWQVGALTARPRAGEKVSSMPRRCTVCDHPESHGIDEALVTGAPYRSVAKRFRTLGERGLPPQD